MAKGLNDNNTNKKINNNRKQQHATRVPHASLTLTTAAVPALVTALGHGQGEATFLWVSAMAPKRFFEEEGPIVKRIRRNKMAQQISRRLRDHFAGWSEYDIDIYEVDGMTLREQLATDSASRSRELSGCYILVT